MTTNEKLEALRDEVVRFAVGCSPEEAATILARIIARWGCKPEQLPTAVQILATQAGFSSAAIVMWFDLGAVIRDTPAGRSLFREVGRVIEAEDAAAAAATNGERSH